MIEDIQKAIAAAENGIASVTVEELEAWAQELQAARTAQATNYLEWQREVDALREQLRWRVIDDGEFPDRSNEFVLMRPGGEFVLPAVVASFEDLPSETATHWLPIPPLQESSDE